MKESFDINTFDLGYSEGDVKNTLFDKETEEWNMEAVKEWAWADLKRIVDRVDPDADLPPYPFHIVCKPFSIRRF